MFSILVCCFIFLSPGIGADASQTTNEFLFMFLSHSGHWWSRPSDLSRLSDSQHRSTCIARPNHRTLILVFYVFGIGCHIHFLIGPYFSRLIRMTNSNDQQSKKNESLDELNRYKEYTQTPDDDKEPFGNHSTNKSKENMKKQWNK